MNKKIVQELFDKDAFPKEESEKSNIGSGSDQAGKVNARKEIKWK